MDLQHAYSMVFRDLIKLLPKLGEFDPKSDAQMFRVSGQLDIMDIIAHKIGDDQLQENFVQATSQRFWKCVQKRG